MRLRPHTRLPARKLVLPSGPQTTPIVRQQGPYWQLGLTRSTAEAAHQTPNHSCFTSPLVFQKQMFYTLLRLSSAVSPDSGAASSTPGGAAPFASCKESPMSAPSISLSSRPAPSPFTARSFPPHLTYYRTYPLEFATQRPSAQKAEGNGIAWPEIYLCRYLTTPPHRSFPPFADLFSAFAISAGVPHWRGPPLGAWHVPLRFNLSNQGSCPPPEERRIMQ